MDRTIELPLLVMVFVVVMAMVTRKGLATMSCNPVSVYQQNINIDRSLPLPLYTSQAKRRFKKKKPTAVK